MTWSIPAGVAAALALGAAPLALVARPAAAEILQIAASGFVQHCPCAVDATDESVETNGVLEIVKQNSRFFASVPFPKDGEKVCTFSLVYRDVNANDAIRARLLKKPFAVGGPAFAAPVVMATASSAPGVPDTVRKATTRAIAAATVAKAGAFYYVLVDAPTINLAFLGVQIDVRPTCPPP